MNGLWCKRCLWHKCRCASDQAATQPPAQWYEIPELEVVDPPPEPQYTRTMTMDDLRRNALESVIEELKERDA